MSLRGVSAYREGVHLIVTARKLAKGSPRRPRQADLRRAISTAYYAVFHGLAENAANHLVGSASTSRNSPAWAQLFRTLDHGLAKARCESAQARAFSAPICACADAFVQLQISRHRADYDPLVRFSRADALDAVALAERALTSLRGAPREERAAFAVHLIYRDRK